MNERECARVREVLPDLALGIADGDARAVALGHLEGCARCRRELEGLASTSDALLLAAPALEPPDGFESSVLAGFEQQEPRSRRGLRVAVVVGIAAALLVFGLFVGLARDSSRESDVAQQVSGWRQLGGESFRAGALVDSGGRTGGQVFAYQGRPSWLVVTLTGQVPRGTYQVLCDYEVGESFDAGDITAAASPAGTIWTTTVPIQLDDLRRVRLVSDRGEPVLEADLPTR